MDDGSRLPWLVAVLLLFCAAYFAITEIALASASRNRMRLSAEHGDTRAKRALYLLDNFDLTISTLLICTNIVHITTATVVTLAVTRRWGLSAVSVSTIITTIVVFFAGEMLPKSIAKKYPDVLLLSCSTAMCFFMKLFAPLAKLLSMIGQAVAKLSKGDPQISVTEDELYDIIEDMTEEGSLGEEQGELISSALQFGDVTLESVLTPRVDLISVNVSSSPDDIIKTILSTKHSRLPVYEGSIDNIIGILQIRKYIKKYLHLGDNTELRPLLDAVIFFHQSTKIDDVLPIMSKHKLNIAVVTDNYGGTLGIVSIEDILEELVGEIWDEDDVVKETVVELSDGLLEVDADETVSNVFEYLSYEDPQDDEQLVNTLMGEWVYEQFASIPKIEDSFRYHRVKITVVSMKNNRILKLRVELLPEDEKGGDAE